MNTLGKYMIMIPLITAFAAKAFAGGMNEKELDKQNALNKDNIEKVVNYQITAKDREKFKYIMKETINKGNISSYAFDDSTMYSSTLSSLKPMTGKEDFVKFLKVYSEVNKRLTYMGDFTQDVKENPWFYLKAYKDALRASAEKSAKKDGRIKNLKDKNNNLRNASKKKTEEFLVYRKNTVDFLREANTNLSYLASSFGENGFLAGTRLPLSTKRYIGLHIGAIGSDKEGDYKFIRALPDRTIPLTMNQYSKTDSQKNHMLYGASFGNEVFGINWGVGVMYLTGKNAKQTSDRVEGVFNDGTQAFENTTKENTIDKENDLFLFFNPSATFGNMSVEGIYGQSLSGQDQFYGAGLGYNLQGLFKENSKNKHQKRYHNK